MPRTNSTESFAGLPPPESLDARQTVTIAITLVAAFFGLVFGFHSLNDGQTLLAYVDFSVALIMVVIAIWSVNQPGRKAQHYAAALPLTLAFLYYFIWGGSHGTGALWSYLVPVCSFFLLGLRGGTIITSAFLSVCLLASVPAISDKIGGYQYGEFYLQRHLGIYLLTGFISFVYESSRLKNYAVLLESRKLNMQLSQAVEQSPAVVVIADLKGNITYVNPKFTQTTGYSAEEALGKNPRILKSGDTDIKLYKELWETITCGKTWAGEFHNRRKNGELYWESAVITPMFDRSGKMINYLALKEDITERREAEVALFESETRHHNIVSTMHDGIIVQDLSGRIIDFNESALRILGLTRDQISGRTSEDPAWQSIYEDGSIFPAADHPSMVTLRCAVPQKNVTMGIMKPDGTRTWILINTMLLRRQMTSSPYGVAAVFNDITERKLTSESLRKESARLANIISAASAGTWEWNVVTGETILNERWAEIIGWNLSELQPVNSGTLTQFLHPEDAEVSRQKLQEHFEKKSEIYSCELRIKHREGYWKWIDVQGRVGEWTSGGKPLRMFGASVDITERKKAQQEITVSREQYMLAVQGSRDGIWDWDIRTNIVYFSPRWKEIIGFADHELVNQFSVWEDRLHPEDKLNTNEQLSAYLNGTSSDYSSEFRMKHKNGSWVWILAKGKALRDAQGKPCRMAGSHTDISERKKSEEELKASIKALEAQTLRANQLAVQSEAASQAKSNFLANMSHEIRTPINGISGMLDILADSELTPSQLQKIKLAKSSATNLLKIINEVLDYSKIEAGKMELDITQFNSQDFFEELAQTMAWKAQEKNLEFIFNIKSNLPPLLIADAGKIRQVLINLISNAIKFTHAGFIVIEASYEKPADGKGRLTVKVQDSGIGIEKEKMPLLFQSFTQIDNTISRKSGGTGLGLAISRQLSRQMQGDILAESQAGTGSVFTFTIEAGDAGEKNIPSSGTLLDRKKILILDDSRQNLDYLKSLLTELGAEVQTCSHVEEFSAHADAYTKSAFICDAFLIDTTLPESECKAVLPVLTKHMEKGTRLICMSPLAGKKESAIELLGMMALDKPVIKNRLITALTAENFADKKNKPQNKKPGNLSGYRILLAEDNFVNQQVVMAFLEKMGVQADIADDGEKALAALRTRIYDLVLMDVRMPNMDGLEAVRRIRSRDSQVLNHSIAVIALTAHALPEDRRRCLEAGMDDYLAKPVEYEALSLMIEKWLPNKNSSEKPLLIFNVQTFSLRLGGKKSQINNLLQMFLQDTAVKFSKLAEDLKSGNLDGAENLVHSIKGSSAEICAEYLFAFSRRMESAALQQDVQTLNKLMPEFSAEFAKFHLEAQRFLSENSSIKDPPA